MATCGTTSSSLLTPEKRTSSASASFEQKWHTPQKPIYGDLTPALKCNRPSCNHDLRLFIPPGTKPNGGVCHFCSKDADAEEVRFSGVRSDEEVVPQVAIYI